MRKLLITISIIISTLSLQAGYTIDSALALADNQYSRGNFHLALREYQRVSFHTDFSDPELLYKLGNCYLSEGDWANARNYYDQVIRTANSDSLRVAAEISKISSLIQEKSYKQALIDLYGIPDTVYQNNSFEINMLFAITHFGLEEFEDSNEFFKKMVPDDSLACARIDSLFGERKLLYRPNPKWAYIFSLILPGLGQVYAGGITEGINSFLLNESLVLISLFVAYEYSIIDAVLSVLPWYNRYYMGGLENAREIAIKRRNMHRSQLYRETLIIIKESDNPE